MRIWLEHLAVNTLRCGCLQTIPHRHCSYSINPDRAGTNDWAIQLKSGKEGYKFLQKHPQDQ